MALLCGHENGDIFAAVSSASGGIHLALEDYALRRRAISIISFHGYNDIFALYNGGSTFFGIKQSSGPSIEEMTKQWAMVKRINGRFYII